jgi:hypothetical protein
MSRICGSSPWSDRFSVVSPSRLRSLGESPRDASLTCPRSQPEESPRLVLPLDAIEVENAGELVLRVVGKRGGHVVCRRPGHGDTGLGCAESALRRLLLAGRDRLRFRRGSLNPGAGACRTRFRLRFRSLSPERRCPSTARSLLWRSSRLPRGFGWRSGLRDRPRSGLVVLASATAAAPPLGLPVAFFRDGLLYCLYGLLKLRFSGGLPVLAPATAAARPLGLPSPSSDGLLRLCSLLDEFGSAPGASGRRWRRPPRDPR